MPAEEVAALNSLQRRADKYGVPLLGLTGAKLAQRHRCAICAEQTDLVIDHDHETGDVRGLLCNGCNTGLGQFRDDPARLARAIDYLLTR